MINLTIASLAGNISLVPRPRDPDCSINWRIDPADRREWERQVRANAASLPRKRRVKGKR